MFTHIKEIFSASNGRLSSMRVMSFEIVQVALFIAVYMTIKCTLSVEMIGMVIGLLSVGLTGKVSQKFVESKEEPKVQ